MQIQNDTSLLGFLNTSVGSDTFNWKVSISPKQSAIICNILLQGIDTSSEG